jgi:hypothetical protein
MSAFPQDARCRRVGGLLMEECFTYWWFGVIGANNPFKIYRFHITKLPKAENILA